MSELGQHLKEVREQKQITLEDLQRTTKIQKRYLLAIEEGRFESLPGLFYARAFVKTYAESIGLDPEPLFDQYRDELPNPRKEAVELPSRSERVKSSGISNKRKVSSLMPALIAVSFFLILIVGIWFVAQWMGQDSGNVTAPGDSSENLDADLGEQLDEEETPPIEEPAPELEPEIAPEPIQEESQPEGSIVLIETKGLTSYFLIEGTETFDAVVQLTGESWVDIKNAKGKTFYSGQPTSGEEISEDFSGEEEIIFNFGASQHVQLIINGDAVTLPLEKNKQKINVRFASDEQE